MPARAFPPLRLSGFAVRSGPTRMPHKQNQTALRIGLLYVLVVCAWILFSDRILVALVSDPAVYRTWQTYKDLVFVAVTSVLLFFVVRQRSRLFQDAEVKRKQIEDALR